LGWEKDEDKWRLDAKICFCQLARTAHMKQFDHYTFVAYAGFVVFALTIAVLINGDLTSHGLFSCLATLLSSSILTAGALIASALDSKP